MKKVTNYEYSKRKGKPPMFFKTNVRDDNHGIFVYNERNIKMQLGYNLDITLLDEYSIYYTRTSETENGSPIFVVKDSTLYLACYWGEINEATLRDEFFEKVDKKEMTAFDAMSFLIL